MIRSLAGNIRNSQRRLMAAMHMDEERVECESRLLPDDNDNEDAETNLLPKEEKDGGTNRLSLMKRMSSKRSLSLSKQKSIPALLSSPKSPRKQMYDKQCSTMSQSSRYFKMPKGEAKADNGSTNGASGTASSLDTKSIKQELVDFLKLQKKKSSRKLGNNSSSGTVKSDSSKSERIEERTAKPGREKLSQKSQSVRHFATSERELPKSTKPECERLSQKSQSVRHFATLERDSPKSTKPGCERLSQKSQSVRHFDTADREYLKSPSKKSKSRSSKDRSRGDKSPRKSKSERHLKSSTRSSDTTSVEELKSSKLKDLPFVVETVEETSVSSFEVEERKSLDTTSKTNLLSPVKETKTADEESSSHMEADQLQEAIPPPPIASTLSLGDDAINVSTGNKKADLKTNLLRIEARLTSILEAMHQTKRRIQLIQHPEQKKTYDDTPSDTESASLSDDEVSMW